MGRPRKAFGLLIVEIMLASATNECWVRAVADDRQVYETIYRVAYYARLERPHKEGRIHAIIGSTPEYPHIHFCVKAIFV